MYIYPTFTNTKGAYSRIWIPDIEYAVALALNSTRYSLK